MFPIKIFLLFFITSCSPSSWLVHTIYNDEKEISTSSLVYTFDDPFSQIELDFNYIEGEFFSFLNCSFLSNYPHSTIVITLQIDQNNESFTCPILQGNERILLPKDCVKKMIFALKNKQTVSFALLDFSEQIKREDFEKKFEKFMNQNQIFDSIVAIFEKILEEPT